MMGGYGYGPGYYRHGHMMGWDYDGSGYRRDYRGYRDEGGYRGQRLCWTETDTARGYGYYAPCRN